MRSSIPLWASAAASVVLCLETSCTRSPQEPKPAAVAAKPLQFNRGGVLHYHDEPIIIDNGPITVYFNPNNDEHVQGHPAGEHHFSRQPAAKIVKARLWKCNNAGNCKESAVDVYKKSVQVYLNTGKALTFVWDDVDEEDKGALLMQSLDHELYEPRPQVIKPVDETLRVESFSYFDKNGKSQSVPLKHASNESVRIHLCTPQKPCPDYGQVTLQ